MGTVRQAIRRRLVRVEQAAGTDWPVGIAFRLWDRGTRHGDLALLDNSPRNAQARAVEPCEMAVFFRADFLGLLETDAVIGYKISLALARHIGLRLREWMGTGRPQLEAL